MKAYLPVVVENVPADQVFDKTGRLLPNVEHYARLHGRPSHRRA